METSANERETLVLIETLAARPGVWKDPPIPDGLGYVDGMRLYEVLLDREWIHGVPLHGDNKLLSIRNVGVTDKGRQGLQDAIRKSRGPSGTEVPRLSIEEKRIRRFQFMKLLYEQTDGNTIATVDSQEIGQQLSWSEDETDGVANYLEREGLVEFPAYGGVVSITHDGVIEVEEAFSAPGEPTDHFAALNVVNVWGDVVQSPMQVGGSQNRQIVSLDVAKDASIAGFVAAFRALLPEMQGVVEGFEAVEADVVTVEAQLGSPRPNQPVIREMLSSLRGVAESLAGSALFFELGQLAQKVHL